MNEPESTAGASELQFDRAEYVAAERTCSACGITIRSQYFTGNGKTLCTECHGKVQAALAHGSPGGRFFAALGWGSAGAVLGAALYYGIREATGYELGLVAIVVGVLVGKGVARGARGRGGGGYQLMAVVLTYFAIVLTYLPAIYQAWQQHQAESATNPIAQAIAGVMLAGLALVSPIYIGIKSPLSLIISGIALYEAWKMNKRVSVTLTGPHPVAPAPPPPPATTTPPPDALGG
jgi:hypothetical protein